jgi:retron-type reverse transcriptase
MDSAAIPADKILNEYFNVEYLKDNIVQSKLKRSNTRGIDRINYYQFQRQSEQQIEIINRNCLKGCYKFAPYLEKLHSKGRSKYPRVIAIPTVRDRIVLIALKEILFQIFPECLPRKLANTYIHEIQKYVEDKNPSQIGVFRTDIKNFYGSINRQRLMEIIKSKTESPKILNLIRRAIETPKDCTIMLLN